MINNMFYRAINNLGGVVGFSEDSYTSIDWKTSPTFTAEELDEEITRLQAEYDSKQYARDRAKAYPSLEEQADMAYWDRQNGTTTLDDAISAVKAQIPKP